ncbi:MAG: TlpA family protein disulfide reductase, partial [Myxococcales bacterium]|nr:TlpA family protein disulfide reductase [Myxococcales bacterium]
KATASAVAAPTSTASVASKPRRDPCLGQELRDPPGALERGRATGGASAPSPLSYGKRWTWVNVWAAWCEPCKKEMPMLLRWRDELRKKGVAIDLVFLSIDDDERELMRFLDGQSQLKSTYWLEGEEAQASWFESVGITGSPKLPVHAFVSPDAKTACVISGSVEEGDYAAIARLTGG